MQSPSLTVGIPVHNGAAYLASCLESVYAQSFEGVEILVIDDASTDGSAELVERLMKPNVRFLRNEHRLGIAGTTNRLVKEARSHWVKFLYQDDELADTCLAEFAPAMTDVGPGIVVCERQYEFEPGIDDTQRSACEALVKHSIHEAFRGCAIVGGLDVVGLVLRAGARMNVIGEPVGVAVRRVDYLAVGGMDARLRQLVDYAAWLRLGLRTGIALVHTPLATFRVHAQSETARNLSAARLYATASLDPLGLWLSLTSDALTNATVPRSVQLDLLRRIKASAREAASGALSPMPSARRARELSIFLLQFRRELAQCVKHQLSGKRLVKS